MVKGCSQLLDKIVHADKAKWGISLHAVEFYSDSDSKLIKVVGSDLFLSTVGFLISDFKMRNVIIWY